LAPHTIHYVLQTGTIFAYGQTSSGKTYTMQGTEDSPGVIQLAIDQIFYMIEEVSIVVIES